MSAVFDRFPTMQKAQDFVAEVRSRFGLEGRAFTSTDNADGEWVEEILCHPFDEIPPFAYIERADEDTVDAHRPVTDEDIEAYRLNEIAALAEFGGGGGQHPPEIYRICLVEERVRNVAKEFGGHFCGT